MRQHAGGGPPARRWQSRPRRLGDRVAIPAGIFRPDMPDHPEPPRDIVEHLGDIFAEPGHGAAAGRASAGAVMLRFVHDLLPGQVVRQLLALGLASLADRQRLVFAGGLADRLGLAGFQLLEPQFELLDLPGHALRGAAKLHPPQLGDLELQLLDLQGAQLDGEPCRLQFRGCFRQFALAGQGKSPQRIRVGGQIGRDQRHTLSLSNATAPDQNEPRIPDLSQQHRSRWRWRCYRPTPIHRLDQQRQLRRCQHHCVVDQRRPDEFTPLQTLGEQTHATAVPVQALQIMTAFAAEEENMTAERIGPDNLLHLGRQTIEAGAQIDRLTGEKNLRSRRQADHRNPRTTDSTRRSAGSSTPPSTRTRTPCGRSISITPARSAKVEPVPREQADAASLDIRIAGLSYEGSATTPSWINPAELGAAPRATSAADFQADRQLYSRLFEIPCRRATTETWPPDASTSANSAAFSCSVHCRRRSTRAIISPSTPRGSFCTSRRTQLLPARFPWLHPSGRFRPDAYFLSVPPTTENFGNSSRVTPPAALYQYQSGTFSSE